MRRWVLVFSLLLGCASASCAAVPLCDYASPRTDLADLSLSFAYDYHDDPYGIRAEDVSTGRLDVLYARLFDSTDFGYSIDVSHHMTVALPAQPDYLISAEGNLKRYVRPEEGADLPIFGFAGATGRSAAEFETIGISMNLGVGYGRFADVTPLAKAELVSGYLVDEYLESLALNDPTKLRGIKEHLDESELVTLAQIVDSAEEYASTAELLREINDEVLGQTDKLAYKDIDALQLHEIEQIITDETFTRYCGGEVRLGLEYELLDPYRGPNNLLATAGFEYALATTPESQFLMQGGLSVGYDVFQAYRVEFSTRYSQVVGDRISFDAGYDYDRERFADREGNQGEPTWRHEIFLQLSLVPATDAWVTLEARFCRQPFFVQWCADIHLAIGVDLL
ncbi:MAG: hypothetical protein JSW65_05990 [Candidatus Bipolaricaulota bacterium]|nr:MAG: hypothetical protein JSW65_05990 [Candidatus Bipolaricaulota bacterium]